MEKCRHRRRRRCRRRRRGVAGWRLQVTTLGGLSLHARRRRRQVVEPLPLNTTSNPAPGKLLPSSAFASVLRVLLPRSCLLIVWALFGHCLSIVWALFDHCLIIV